jgi:hypothetical protein
MAVVDTKGLPLPLVAAIQNDDHISQGSDLGVTSLVAPVQQVALRRRHQGESTEEAADRIWALLGQAVHVVLERAGKDQNDQRRKLNDALALLKSLTPITEDVEKAIATIESHAEAYRSDPQPFRTFIEERWETTVLGWRIAARCDHLTLEDTGTLTDWKVSSVWSLKDGKPKPEWVAQVNVTRRIATLDQGFRPQNLACTVIARDWRKRERRRFGTDYPPYQVGTLPVPYWSDDECDRYLLERVAAHQAAANGDPLPPCTPEERWEKPMVFAVMKKGRKTAKRLWFSRAEAEAYITRDKDEADLFIVERPGESPRCADYCEVLDYCAQGQAILAALKPPPAEE